LALLGFLLLVLETLRLAGILRSGNALPLAFTVTLPVFWLVFFLWKAGPSEAGSDNRCVDLFHFSQPCSLWFRATRRSVSLLWLRLPRLLRLYARPPGFQHSANEWEMATSFPPFGLCNHGRNNRSSVASMNVRVVNACSGRGPHFSVSVVADAEEVVFGIVVLIPKVGLSPLKRRGYTGPH
jgi:hypothetical protein